MAAILRPALAGPLNLVIVGDMSVDRAIEAARTTIGALPPCGPRPTARDARFPTVPAKPVIVADHGSPSDAVAVAAWPTPGFFASTADSRVLQVLAKIVEERLLDGLRGKDGLTYSPTVLVDQSELFASYGAIAAEVELTPAKTDQFFAAVTGIVADLAKTPVSLAELDRARTPLLDASRHQLYVTNYWASTLVGVDEDARQLDTIRSRVPDLAAVRPADIQRLARTYLASAPYRAVFETAPTDQR